MRKQKPPKKSKKQLKTAQTEIAWDLARSGTDLDNPSVVAAWFSAQPMHAETSEPSLILDAAKAIRDALINAGFTLADPLPDLRCNQYDMFAGGGA